jgi:hypothetical protein
MDNVQKLNNCITKESVNSLHCMHPVVCRNTKRVFIYRLHNNVLDRTFICVLTLLHVSVSLDHHQAGYMKITKIIAYFYL